MKLLRIMLTVFVATFLVEAQDLGMQLARKTRNGNRNPAGRNQGGNRNYPNVTHISVEKFKTAIKRTIQKIKAYRQFQAMLRQVERF